MFDFFTANPFDTLNWKPYDFGEYHRVQRSTTFIEYKGYNCLWVYREPFMKLDLIDKELISTTRSIKYWHLVNPDLPVLQYRQGMVAPYLGHKQANDNLIARALFDIYLQHRIIMWDATIYGNVLVYNDKPVIVDFDYMFSPTDPLKYEAWQLREEHFQSLWQRNISKYPQAITLTLCLIYIEQQIGNVYAIPDNNLSFAVIKLVNSYRINNKKITLQHFELFSHLAQDENFSSIKISPELCEELLESKETVSSISLENNNIKSTRCSLCNCISRCLQFFTYSPYTVTPDAAHDLFDSQISSEQALKHY